MRKNSSKTISLYKTLVLIHGLKDNIVNEDVPKNTKKVNGKNVNIIYLKESDHRLSSLTDLTIIKELDYVRKIIKLKN